MTEAVAARLQGYLRERRLQIEEALLRVLPEHGSKPADLVAAMRYSVLAGGKRLRPILFLAAAETCERGSGGDADREGRLEAAAALELFHTYSLIHDDLPCMDDDSLRRGKPTCHVAFGEATALLAGDALQTLGFEVLATRPRGDSHAVRRAEAVALAAQAIGARGMAGGQALDLSATGGAAGPEAAELLLEIHARKTGRLLAVSLELGALHAGAGAPMRAAIAAYGESIGLLFQIADDLLDVTADAGTLGKTAGKDSQQHKLTYPAVFGLDGARAELEKALQTAVCKAGELEEPGGLLGALAEYAARRDR